MEEGITTYFTNFGLSQNELAEIQHHFTFEKKNKKDFLFTLFE